jgi:hypothetical protein
MPFPKNSVARSGGAQADVDLTVARTLRHRLFVRAGQNHAGQGAIITNVVLFVVNVIVGDAMTIRLGLSPRAVFDRLAAVHVCSSSTSGVRRIRSTCSRCDRTEMERTWGTRFFVKCP